MKPSKAILLSKADVMSAVLCALLIIPGVSVYDRLPDKVAIHFNINAVPDEFASKSFVVFGIPLVMTAVQLTLCLITNLFNKTDARDLINRIIRLADPIILYISQLFILLYALDRISDPVSVLITFMAFFYIIEGNYMPKMRRNMFLGVRTPHTLADKEVWDKTHRFAGVVYIICGILIIPFSLVSNYLAAAAMVVFQIVTSFIYSEAVYRAEKSRVQKMHEAHE